MMPGKDKTIAQLLRDSQDMIQRFETLSGELKTEQVRRKLWNPLPTPFLSCSWTKPIGR